MVEQTNFPRVTSWILSHVRLTAGGGTDGIWATPWRRCSTGFVLWTRYRCTLETAPFEGWGHGAASREADKAEPTATSVSPMSEETSVEIAPKSWYRCCGTSERGLQALLFFPAFVVAQTEYGERLPFFVYGTLRSGYANHRKFMRGELVAL